MISSFGQMLHYAMVLEPSMVPIEKELDYVKRYVALQQMRFEQQLILDCEMDSGAADIRIPKMTIQPLIENAIYYGMEYMDGDGEITIRAYTRRSDLFIEVEDNGLGMPEEQVERLLTDDTRIRSKGSGIGLRNVHQRIQLYFGKAYGLKIISERDQGTIVRIHLPKTEEVKAPGEVEA